MLLIDRNLRGRGFVGSGSEVDLKLQKYGALKINGHSNNRPFTLQKGPDFLKVTIIHAWKFFFSKSQQIVILVLYRNFSPLIRKIRNFT